MVGSNFIFPLFTMSQSKRVRTLPRDELLAGQKPVCDDSKGLVSVSAFADDDLLHSKVSGHFKMLQRHPGKLDVIIPEPVVHRVVAQQFGGKRII